MDWYLVNLRCKKTGEILAVGLQLRPADFDRFLERNYEIIITGRVK